jgi:hypothetical protein
VGFVGGTSRFFYQSKKQHPCGDLDVNDISPDLPDPLNNIS